METKTLGTLRLLNIQKLFAKLISILRINFQNLHVQINFQTRLQELTLQELLYTVSSFTQFSSKKNATYQQQNLQLSIFILSLHLYDRNIHLLEFQGQYIIPGYHIISSIISNVFNFRMCRETEISIKIQSLKARISGVA